MDIFVGNFPFETTEEELAEAFASFGNVERVKLMYDRETQRPRGFGFVTMSEPQAAEEAIREMDGKDFGGRKLRVNEAQRRERPSGGGGGRDNRNFRDNKRGGGNQGGGKRWDDNSRNDRGWDDRGRGKGHNDRDGRDDRRGRDNRRRNRETEDW